MLSSIPKSSFISLATQSQNPVPLLNTQKKKRKPTERQDEERLKTQEIAYGTILTKLSLMQLQIEGYSQKLNSMQLQIERYSQKLELIELQMSKLQELFKATISNANQPPQPLNCFPSLAQPGKVSVQNSGFIQPAIQAGFIPISMNPPQQSLSSSMSQPLSQNSRSILQQLQLSNNLQLFPEQPSITLPLNLSSLCSSSDPNSGQVEQARKAIREGNKDKAALLLNTVLTRDPHCLIALDLRLALYENSNIVTELYVALGDLTQMENQSSENNLPYYNAKRSAITTRINQVIHSK